MADEEGIMRPQPRPTTELSYSDIEKIERVVWGEARGETVEGRNAIRGVILNRLASGRFGDTIDEVLIGSQFNTIDDHGNGRIENIPVPQEDMDMLMNEAADYYMLGSDASEGRTFYQNEATATGRYEGVDPTQIGSHTFYRGLAGQEPVHDTNFSHNIRIVPDEDIQLAEMNEGGLATADPEEEVGFWGRLFGRGSEASDDEIPVNTLSLPMSADPDTDIIVGQTEWGSPVYRSQLGEDYWIRPVSQERTYESEAGTWDRAGEIGMTLAEGAVDGLINGFTAPGRALRGETLTYGDALETAGMANVGAMPFTVPEGSLRTFMSGTRPRDAAAPEAQYTLSDFGYTQDNPGGEWLQRKQERAEQEIIDNEEGRFGRGITGSVTGSLGMRQDMFLPTNRLFELPGLNGEMRRPGDFRFDALLERVREEGFDPNQAGNRVVVAVNHRGEAFLMEGNTRVAVANELGVPSVRAEVRYWNGGEDVEGPFSPGQTVEIASPTPLESPESAEGFAKGGLALDQSEALKGITTEAGYEMAQKKPQMDRSRADQDGDGQVSAAEEVAETARRTVGKDDIAEMNCGGIMMPEMEIDPVSGNEVPLGSTPENVRDDIPAMLSQDEYVLPAHVVKWHGLKHIQEMQMEAEAGLMAMAFEGLIGGEDMEEAAVEADEADTMEDEYVEDMDVEVESPVVEVEDDLEDEAYEEEPETSELPGMVKKQKYAFIIS